MTINDDENEIGSWWLRSAMGIERIVHFSCIKLFIEGTVPFRALPPPQRGGPRYQRGGQHCIQRLQPQWAMQNPFSTVALEPTYDAQPGPNVPLQGGSATGVMPPMKKTTMLFHALFKVACLPADAGPTAPAVRCSPVGPTRAGVGPRRVHLRVVDLR